VSPKWLTSLVRARQIQEDAAQAELAEARRRGRMTKQHVRREGDRLDAMCAAEVPESAAAFVAASVALQAAAATHAAAVDTADQAERAADERHSTFTEAARARLAAERMQEQHDDHDRRSAARAEQRDNDEVAGYRHGINGGAADEDVPS
jgi:flagellar export protein FliJ